jgi:glycosyltransferase involved in cell wall biosynthesis
VRILCVNSTISERGGAELSALNLAIGLADRGHEVHFLGAEVDEVDSTKWNDETSTAARRGMLYCHYRKFPRIYPLGEKHGGIRKFLWHLQDLIHPANEAIFAEVLKRTRPDAVILHNTTAIGSNVWRTICKRKIPCVQVIHDLGLVCLNKARFRAGRQCAGLCALCSVQKAIRVSLIGNSSHFTFVSPSRAMLDEIERYVDLSPWRKEVIANPNNYVVEQRDISKAKKPTLLYVGRLDPSKGVDFVLDSADQAHDLAEFDFDILGTGSLEASLRQKYAHKDWIRFRGYVDQKSIADFMSRATVILVPSLWLENAPGVVAHALFAGLPVLGSRIGGIPEYVVDGLTGRLLPPGDKTAWAAEIVRVVCNQDQVNAWSAACLQAAQRYDPEAALDAYERLLHAVVIEEQQTSAEST